MQVMLAANEATEAFNADYYLAVITILPILMIATEVLTNLNKSVPNKISQNWPAILGLVVGIYYLLCPIIAAFGIVIGVLALMYRNTGAVDQWITFSCLISVLAFLAIASSIYLYVFDSADTRRQYEEQRTKSTLYFGG